MIHTVRGPEVTLQPVTPLTKSGGLFPDASSLGMKQHRPAFHR